MAISVANEFSRRAKVQISLSRKVTLNDKPHIVPKMVPHMGRAWDIFHPLGCLLGSTSPSNALRRWSEITNKGN